ncbi:hypothetical protein BDW75DRAFT_250551 [Aspergillus navahoensis]
MAYLPAIAVMGTMPLRRSHAKSHHGCAQCKQRRIKCDEARPVCGSCQRKQLSCAFDSFAPPPSAASHAPLRDSVLPLQELELLHDWHTATCASLVSARPLQDIMRTTLPQEGLFSPFLLHGILAIAALRRAQTATESARSRQKYKDIAMAHHSSSLILCGQVLDNITQANCHALFAFSCLVPIFIIATHKKGSIIDVVESFNLLRGAASVVDRARPWIEKGPLHPLLRLGHFYQPLSAAQQQRGAALVIRIQSTMKNMPGMQLESSVRSSFESLLHLVQIYLSTGDERAVLAWPVQAETLYFDLLLQRNQAAVTVLGLFGHALGIIPAHWWLEGWGMLLVTLSRECLGDPDLM